MQAITERGLRRHSGEKVRVARGREFIGKYVAKMEEDEKGFYQALSKGRKYRLRDGDRISIVFTYTPSRSRHASITVREYEMNLKG
jgi:hypothetical protein